MKSDSLGETDLIRSTVRNIKRHTSEKDVEALWIKEAAREACEIGFFDEAYVIGLD